MTAYRTLCVLQNNVCIISERRTPLVIVDNTYGETTVVLGLQMSGVENAGAKNAGTPKNAANLFH